MKILSISNLKLNSQINNTPKENVQVKQDINGNNKFNLDISCKNYVIPFMAKYDKELPISLEETDIDDCNPMTSSNSDTGKLSGVISTALKYITPTTPLLLGCSNRGQSRDFILDVFENNDIFSRKQKIDDIIFVEDDRIIDEPIMFTKNNKGETFLIGDVLVKNKDTNEKEMASSKSKMRINLNKQSIKFNLSEMDYISLGEEPAKPDLKYIKKYNIDEIFDNPDFPETGRIISDEVTTTVTQRSRFKPSNYPLFKDIGGNKEAIQRIIEDIYAPLCYPDLLGNDMNRGTILVGPPGTGKSMLGIALCNELSRKLGKPVDLEEISGAEMQTSAVGGSESNWRALFKKAIDRQPALILIDEIDACTQKRDGSSNARFDNQVVNQLLTLMSRLEKSNDLVYVIAMTNRLEAIDPAILRQGRFGNMIEVPAPKGEELKDIFYKISGKYKFDESVDIDAYLKRIERMKGTGATIAGTLQRAKKNSMRRNNLYEIILNDTAQKEDIDSALISMEDLTKALDIEEEKLKKAKINSDRVVIKGFSN